MNSIVNAKDYFFNLGMGYRDGHDGVLTKLGSPEQPDVLVSFSRNKFSGNKLAVEFVYLPILVQFGFQEKTTIKIGHGQYGISLTGNRCLCEDGFSPKILMEENSLPANLFGTFNEFYVAVSKIEGWSNYFVNQIENQPGQKQLWYSMAVYSLLAEKTVDVSKCRELMQLHAKSRDCMEIHLNRQKAILDSLSRVG